jgi:hypothetical protein
MTKSPRGKAGRSCFVYTPRWDSRIPPSTSDWLTLSRLGSDLACLASRSRFRSRYPLTVNVPPRGASAGCCSHTTHPHTPYLDLCIPPPRFVSSASPGAVRSLPHPHPQLPVSFLGLCLVPSTLNYPSLCFMSPHSNSSLLLSFDPPLLRAYFPATYVLGV